MLAGHRRPPCAPGRSARCRTCSPPPCGRARWAHGRLRQAGSGGDPRDGVTSPGVVLTPPRWGVRPGEPCQMGTRAKLLPSVSSNTDQRPNGWSIGGCGNRTAASSAVQVEVLGVEEDVARGQHRVRRGGPLPTAQAEDEDDALVGRADLEPALALLGNADPSNLIAQTRTPACPGQVDVEQRLSRHRP